MPSGICAAIFEPGFEDAIDRCEALGIAHFLCLAQKYLIGAIDLKQLPKPSLLIKTTVPCSSSNMQYEYLAARYKALSAR
ncbi:MAG: hypothetical protein ACTSXJ_06660 [Candidatus Baldrarchaeia archaeon]